MVTLPSFSRIWNKDKQTFLNSIDSLRLRGGKQVLKSIRRSLFAIFWKRKYRTW